MTNLGLWNPWYADMTDDALRAYGDTETYTRGAEWLAPCALVEDWGSGGGWLRNFIEPERYRGIDGSDSPFVDEIVDLAHYRSDVPGIFMRHVIEHDFRWAQILDNAIASFTERMALILFTPLVEHTEPIAFLSDPGVPDIAFALDDLTGPLDAAGINWSVRTLDSETGYGVETIIYAWR